MGVFSMADVRVADRSAGVELIRPKVKKDTKSGVSPVAEGIESAATAVGTVGMIIAFSMFFAKAAIEIFSTVARFYILPVVLAMDFIALVVSWRDFYARGQKNHLLAKAVMATASFVIGLTMIAAVLASGLFAVATPAVYVGIAAANALYHFGFACYNGIKAMIATNEKDKAHFKARAKSHLISSASNALVSIAFGLAMIAGGPVLAPLGATFGVIGLCVGLFNLCRNIYNAYIAPKSSAQIEVVDDKEVNPSDPDSTQQMNSRMRAEHSVSMRAGGSAHVRKPKPVRASQQQQSAILGDDEPSRLTGSVVEGDEMGDDELYHQDLSDSQIDSSEISPLIGPAKRDAVLVSASVVEPLDDEQQTRDRSVSVSLRPGASVSND
jgi:hypothetical protein